MITYYQRFELVYFLGVPVMLMQFCLTLDDYPLICLN